jgi:glycerophosphoryl diester phosphodiesterase
MMQRCRTRIVSHRGGALLWLENSLEAFQNSLRIGVDALECDVHLSADGVPVVLHDATLERTTFASGTVAEQSAQSLCGTRLRGHDRATIPNLLDVASLLQGKPQTLQIEIKGAGRFTLLQRSLAVADAAAIRPQTSIIAFDAAIAGAAARTEGLAEAAWLFSAASLQKIGTTGVISIALAEGIRLVETEIGATDADLCSTLRRAGLGVGAWGANDEPTLRKAFDLGLDLVATDDPALALSLRPG